MAKNIRVSASNKLVQYLIYIKVWRFENDLHRSYLKDWSRQYIIGRYSRSLGIIVVLPLFSACFPNCDAEDLLKHYSTYVD